MAILTGFIMTALTYALVSIERALHAVINGVFESLREKVDALIIKIGTLMHRDAVQVERRYPRRNRRAPLRYGY